MLKKHGVQKYPKANLDVILTQIINAILMINNF